MRCLGRIVAFLIVLILIGVIPTTIWMVAMWDVGTAPETYTDTLDDDVYESLAPLLLPALADGILEDEFIPEVQLVLTIIEHIDEQEWETISTQIIEPAWLQEEVGRNMSGLLRYLHADTNAVSVVINTQEVHVNLTENREQIARQLTAAMAEWEPCTAHDAAAYRAFLAEERTTLPICAPPPAVSANFETAVVDGLERMADEMPANQPLVLKDRLIEEGETTAEEYDEGLQGMRRFVVFVDNAGPVFLLFPVMLMGLIVVFAVRSTREFFLWAGLPLVVGGLFTALPLVSWLYTLTEPFQDTDSSLEALGAVALLEVTQALARSFTTPVLVVTFLMVGTGFIFLVLSSILPTPQEPVQQFFYVPTSNTPTPTPIPTHTPPQQRVPDVSISTPSPVTPIPPAEEAAPEPPRTETAHNPNLPSGETGTFMDDLTFTPGTEADMEDVEDTEHNETDEM